MDDLLDRLLRRLLPAVLAALGVSIMAAGLLTYLDPVTATPPGSEAPTAVVETPGPTTLLTFPPLVTPTSSPSPSSGATGGPVATRVVVPGLGIDLPVIKQPSSPSSFPPCNVAMYLLELHQPGQPGPTYIYAHARTGMFLPILQASQVNNGRRMLGMLVQVYTSDDQLYLYVVSQVRRHVTTLDGALAEQRETLWLQTSEGPRGTIEKTQVIALPLSHGPADPKEAHPKAVPVFCQ